MNDPHDNHAQLNHHGGLSFSSLRRAGELADTNQPMLCAMDQRAIQKQFAAVVERVRASAASAADLEWLDAIFVNGDVQVVIDVRRRALMANEEAAPVTHPSGLRDCETWRRLLGGGFRRLLGGQVGGQRAVFHSDLLAILANLDAMCELRLLCLCFDLDNEGEVQLWGSSLAMADAPRACLFAALDTLRVGISGLGEYAGWRVDAMLLEHGQDFAPCSSLPGSDRLSAAVAQEWMALHKRAVANCDQISRVSGGSVELALTLPHGLPLLGTTLLIGLSANEGQPGARYDRTGLRQDLGQSATGLAR